jgi:hypothetical protein
VVVPFGVAKLGADHDAGAEDQYRDEDCTHSAQDQSGDPVRSVQLPPPGPLALRDWSARRVGVYKSLRGFSRAFLRSGVMTELKRSNFVGSGRQNILTDTLGVPLVLSTTVFAAVLAVIFGVWYARERTLSIHSITTTPRELFYWLAVLATFALGTAAGDWTLELTGWGPGISVLLPAGLIVAIFVGRQLGANAVLSFWLAYILTRPLGANLGDWLGFPKDQQGLGLGVAITSVIFLTAILATVVYLTYTRADVIETQGTCDGRQSRSRDGHARVLRRRRRRCGRVARVGCRAAALHGGRQRERVGLVGSCQPRSGPVGDCQVPAGRGREVPRRRPRRQGLAYLSCPQRASALLNGR